LAVAGVAIMGLAVGACDIDKLLEARSPTRIPAERIERDPATAALFVNSAIGNFECAFGSYIVAGGLIGEELEDATATANRFPYDRRNTQPADIRYSTFGCEAVGTYAPLQTARVSANTIRRWLEEWTDQELANRRLLLAQAAAFEAYSMLLLGEGFCSMVFSTIADDGITVEYGTEITRQQVFQQAETRFGQAIAEAEAVGTTASNVLNLARVGRARTRLNLAVVNGAVVDAAKLADARLEAAAVPPTFVYNMTAEETPNRRENRVWDENNSRFTPTSTVGTHYRTLNDPRVPVQNLNRNASNTGVALWLQLKYPQAQNTIPIASGDEAQLIVAEADIVPNPNNTITLLDMFRARGNQGPYAGGLTPAELRAEVIDQRRRELYLEGQHLGDVIRYGIALRPSQGTPFPGGGTFENQVCLPLPQTERLNNPMLQ
jgi:hypothetical protein